jgi:NACalpha-BTF3-like transcription factor
VRKEWLNFISTWYEPEKKKLTDQIMKELDVKYKKTASIIQQAARQTEKENRLSEIAAQLSEPAHEEWEKRLAAAQLQVDDWTDITDQEQQFVLGVFVGLFGDDDDDEEEEEEDEDSATLNSNDIEDVTSEVDGFDFPTIRQSPPTPVTGNFELVNPSSFFADTVSPRNQSRKLPELAMVRFGVRCRDI